jgi:hypothetical protein
MINDLIHWLLATFVIAPVQADIDTKLRAASASGAVAAQVQNCMADATPALLAKAGNDWLWTTKTVISVATGVTQPEQVLSDQVPACRPAVEAIRQIKAGDSS